MCPVSACLLQAPLQWSLDQTEKFLCRSLANEEKGTVWPEQKTEKERLNINLCHENNFLNEALSIGVLCLKLSHILTEASCRL